jgi:hypothetical protein
MNGAQRVTLPLGHEQTAETTDMDLTNNLMDAEPIQTFDGYMGIHCSLEFIVDDGIFLPDSTFQELHKTLHNHIFHTDRSKPPSHHRSPERVSLASPQDGGHLLRLPSQNKQNPKCTVKAHQRSPN